MTAPEIHNNKEFVSIREAATMLACSPQRVYQYVRGGRISAQRIGRMLILPVKEVQQFKRTPSGRRRTKTPPWHIYQSRNTFLATIIQVQIRDSMREKLLAKLNALPAKKHTFRGSMARYIIGDSETMELLIIWKESEQPNDMIRQQDLHSFQKEFSELNWETAQYFSKDVFLHT